MKRLIALLGLLFATAAMAADNPISCSGASCKQVFYTRTAGGAQTNAGQIDATQAWTIGPSGGSVVHTLNGNAAVGTSGNSPKQVNSDFNPGDIGHVARTVVKKSSLATTLDFTAADLFSGVAGGHYASGITDQDGIFYFRGHAGDSGTTNTALFEGSFYVMSLDSGATIATSGTSISFGFVRPPVFLLTRGSAPCTTLTLSIAVVTNNVLRFTCSGGTTTGDMGITIWQ